ncbi:nucleoside deaminase [Streptomyces sp. NPDC046821]|uniref:nucleoside deaminase n=1 Tax=Streptomyces sp. NPDC046821 TaxID=3154702 RepID=UPI0033F03647
MDWVSLSHLRRCVELARESLEAGDEPFGSVLVDGDGKVLAEDRNRSSSGDPTRHPEFALARWAAERLTPEERARATVYTSSEHCAMCAAAHGWVGLGRIVYASSTDQLTRWFTEMGFGAAPVAPLSVPAVAPQVRVEGPVDELAVQVRQLIRTFHGKDQDTSEEERKVS